MTFLTSFLRRIRNASGSVRTSHDLSAFLRDGDSNFAGVSVTPDRARQVSAVFACVRVLSETLAQVPLELHRRLDDGSRERAKDHPLYTLLHRRPNRIHSSFEWRRLLQLHASLRGQAFALKSRVRGEVRELLPVHPDAMQIAQLADGSLKYKMSGLHGEKEFAGEDVLHIRGLSSDGISGLDLSHEAKEAIGLAIALERHGSLFFKNGAKMSGILKHPNHFSDTEIRDRVRDSWEQATSGAYAHRTAILEDGLDWQQINWPNDAAQFTDTRKEQTVEIARYFRMPLHKIQSLDKTTVGNMEQLAREFVTDTMMPWFVSWEQRLSLDLLTPQQQEEYFFEFNVDGLLRGDPKTRNESYDLMRRNGVLSANEWRAKENLNRIPDASADQYWMPVNMTTTDNPVLQEQQDDPIERESAA